MTATATDTKLEERISRRYMDGEITKGATVEVYKGRKVPVGTVGQVFWVGAGNYGYRVGLNDDAGTTHWTAMSNCRVWVTDKDLGESWQEYDARKQAEAHAAEAKLAALPKRWDIVVVIDEPEFVGKIFWMSHDGSRCGVAREGARRVRNAQGQLRNKPEDTRWVDAAGLCQRHLYTPELTEVEETVDEPADDDDDDLGCF